MLKLENLINSAFQILHSAGYRLQNISPDSTEFVFEASNIIGVIFAFESADALIGSWESAQTSFLQRYGMHIRRSGEKAWNVYSIFMTSDEPNETTCNNVASIEEDFTGTRKIARTGIRSRLALVNALLPVLPLQYRLALQYEEPQMQLRARIELPEEAVDALLRKENAFELVRILLEAQ